MKATKYNDEDCGKKYKVASNNVRKEIKKVKENFLLKRCEEIERGFENNNSKLAYKVVEQLTKEKSAKVPVIEDAQGNLLTEAGKIQERFGRAAGVVIDNNNDKWRVTNGARQIA